MTVYVHKPRGQGTVLFGETSHPDPWFALTADTDDELHASAASLGLTRAMFRPGTPARRRQPPVADHYDLTLGERDQAVELGAQPITARDADRRERQRAAGLGYN
jgi:Protein of unknown function (DUF4031)